jgi:hypothetical protein
MLPIELKQVFMRFFEGVDHYVSDAVTDESGTGPEVAYTRDFLRCLNTKRPAPKGLSPTASEFQAEVDATLFDLGLESDAKITLSSESFSQQFEGHVTQADYAMLLSFRDTSEDEVYARGNSWDAIYYFQAKVAKKKGPSASIDGVPWNDSAFFVKTSGQAESIDVLREYCGSGGLRYNLYCPSGALKLCEHLSLVQRLKRSHSIGSPDWQAMENAGVWLHEMHPETLADVFNSASFETYPWSLFIVDHFFQAVSSAASPEKIALDAPDAERAEFDRRLKLFRRDPATIQEIIDALDSSDARARAKRAFQFSEQGYQGIVEVRVEFPAYDYEHRLDPDGPKSSGPSPSPF